MSVREIRYQLRNWHHVNCLVAGGACTCLEQREVLIAELASQRSTPDSVPATIFTAEEVARLHRYQFGPWERFGRMHPFTCPNRGTDHFDNGSDLGALIPTVRGWICQCCDYTQGWAHAFMSKPTEPASTSR